MAHPGEDVAVRLFTSGSVAVVTLDRPSQRNAIHRSDWLELPRLIRQAERDDAVRLIVLRGAGGCFGAGNDISELAGLRGDPASARAYAHAMADATATVEDASKPVMAAIEGVCYGASVALALAADIRIAREGATFAVTPAKLGALYLRSDLHRLARTIGPSAARRLIFTADAVDAATALRMGLIDEVFTPGAFEARLSGMAQAVARGSGFTLRRSKAMLLDLAGVRAPAETAESLSCFVEATQGGDFAEGSAAFLAKRPASFVPPTRD